MNDRSPIEPGQSLGHYRLLRQLGAGGMGEVWEAQDTRLGRSIALKILPSQMAESADRIDRFEREAKALAALDHPNIITIHSVEEADGVHFLTMGLVSGRTLGEMVPEHGMSVDELLEIAVPLAGAVAAAHEKGITHRDLKPGNVMVNDEGTVKVLDFGLAKFESESVDAELASELPTKGFTAEGAVMGTAEYMSPEQIEGKPIDHRSDIFSLGVMLYEMVTGKRPFSGDSSAALMSSVLKDQPQPVLEVRADLPRQLGRIVGQCLEKDPRDRFQTARDVFNALRNLSREVASDDSWVSSVQAHTELGPSKATRRWVLVTVLLAATMVLVWVGFVDDESGVDRVSSTPESQVAQVGAGTPPMIAVLPFENMGAAEDEYFALGMTEEITTRLAGLSEIGVIASTSARKYAGTDKSANAIGAELGADYLVLGSVRWAKESDGSSRIRINPRVIQTADDTQLWAESYDRVFEDVFGIQSDIASQVVHLLDLEIGDSARSDFVDRPTENMQAYDQYLKALAVPGLHANEVAIRERRQLLAQAIELDPMFADAWAELAEQEARLYGYGYDRSENQKSRAWDTLVRAAEMNAVSPARVHDLYGHYYFIVERDYQRSMEEIVQALRIEPNNSRSQQRVGFVLRRMGRFEEALVELQKAQRLDPRDSNLSTQVGSIQSYLGQFEQALASYDRALEIEPDSAGLYSQKAEVYWRWKGDVGSARAILDSIPPGTRLDSSDLRTRVNQLVFEGRFEEALAFLDSLDVEAIGLAAYYRPISMLAGFIYELLGDAESARQSFESAAAHLENELGRQQRDHVKRIASLAVTYAALGRKEEAESLGKQAAELRPLEEEEYIGQTEALDLAWVYALVGEYDSAFEQLEILLSRPSWITIPYLELDPRWRNLRELPRFEELKAEFG